jgi:TorA maturation chaperone TorD
MTPDAAELAFFGHAFLEPDPVALAALAGELELPGWESAVADDAAALAIEYNRLFLNPLGSPCALWQSANSEEGHLMGQAHLSALEWYRRFGAEPAASNEPADHVGLLLLFLAHLLDSGTDSEVVRRFGSEHLAWIPEFCEGVRQATTIRFYRAAADRLREILHRDLNPEPLPERGLG